MKYKVIVWMFVLIALVGMVNAVDLTRGLVSVYNLSGNTDTLGYKNMADGGVPTYKSSGCMKDDCLYSYSTKSGYLFFDTFSTADWNNATGFCYSMWLYANLTADNIVFGNWKATSTTHYQYFQTNSWRIRDGSNNDDIAMSISLKSWQFLVFCYNSTSNDVWVNGTFFARNPLANSHVFDGINLGWGGSSYNVNTDANFDEIYLWNRRLNQSEIDFLYNSGSGNFYEDFASTPPAPSTIDNINLSTTVPTNNTIFNLNDLTFNVTMNNSKTTNISLYINGVQNQSFDFYLSGTNQFIQFQPYLSDGSYTYYIYAVQSNDTTQNETTSTFDFIIDTIQPDITWYSPNTTNNSVISNVFTTNISIYDTNLYSYEFNITYTNGTSIYNRTNTSLTGTTLAWLSFTFGNLTGSEYLAKLRVCDGHTSNEIDFNSKKMNEELLFADDSVKVYMFDKSKNTHYDSIKKTDRYNFVFGTKSKTTKEFFVVESTEYIDIVMSDYAGHLVIPRLNKWIDFETTDLKKVEVFRGGPNMVVVEVTKNNPTDIWYFESIGELNCVTEEKSFFNINYTQSFTSNVLSGQSNTFNLDLSYDSDYINSYVVYMYYNNTPYLMVGTSGNPYQFTRTLAAPNSTIDANLSVWYNVTYNSNQNLKTSTFNQSSYAFRIDNCTIYNTGVLNFTFLNELNGTGIDGTIDFNFQIESGSYSISYGGTDSGYFVDFCMYPSWANASTGDITIQYGANGYDSRDWVRSSFDFTNITTSINLYLLESGSSTPVTIHVVDDADNDLSNVYIETYKYDIATDTDNMVEVEYTDSEGRAIMNIVTGTTYYSFKFYQNGNLVLQTTRFKIFSTTLEYVIRESEQMMLSQYLLLNGITRTLTYTNSTRQVDFTYTDADDLAYNICLSIYYSNGTDLNSQCSTSDADTLSYILSSLNTTYYAIARAQFGETANYYVLETLNIDTREDWRIIGGDNSLIISILILFTFSLMGLINASIGIIAVNIGLIGLYYFGLIPIGFSSIAGILFISVLLLVTINMRKF